MLNKTDMRMLCWIHGISLKYHIRSEKIRNGAKVKPIVAHVTSVDMDTIRRGDLEDITRMVLETAGKRPRGWSRIRWMSISG